MKQIVKVLAIVIVALLYVELTAEDLSKTAPYSGIKWVENGTIPMVTFGEKEFELLEINGVSVKKVMDFCKKQYGDKAYVCFNEHLPRVFKDMKEPLGKKVELLLKDPVKDRIVMKKDVLMTKENRKAIVGCKKEKR